MSVLVVDDLDVCAVACDLKPSGHENMTAPQGLLQLVCCDLPSACCCVLVIHLHAFLIKALVPSAMSKGRGVMAKPTHMTQSCSLSLHHRQLELTWGSAPTVNLKNPAIPQLATYLDQILGLTQELCLCS